MNRSQFQSWIQDNQHQSLVMGILNVTPDSFSDGGKYLEIEKAVAHGVVLIEEGADILDIGGESADAAIRAGADMVNDVSGLRSEAMRRVVADHKVPVVIMHMKDMPKTMQDNPDYVSLMDDITSFFQQQIDAAVRDGIPNENIIVDPGIGFGKTAEDNFELIRKLDAFLPLKKPILVGPSRKSFIGLALDLPEHERMEGTSAAVTAGILNGASIVRVHDVKEMKRVAVIADRIRGIA